jgi:hypothetical protein
MMDNERLKHFRTCKNFSLHRSSNGWLLKGGISSLLDTTTDMTWVLVFESTKSLGEQLPSLLGDSGWRISMDPPMRDEKGHFIKPKP